MIPKFNLNINVDPLQLLHSLTDWLKGRRHVENDELSKSLKDLIGLEDKQLANIERRINLIKALQLPQEVTLALISLDLKELELFSRNIVVVLEKIQRHLIEHISIQDYPCDEKRKYPRYDSYKELRVSARAEKYCRALLLNISRGGAYIRSSELLSPGDSLVVELPAVGSRPAQEILARVVRPEENGLRLQFLSPIAESYATLFQHMEGQR